MPSLIVMGRNLLSAIVFAVFNAGMAVMAACSGQVVDATPGS